MSSSGDLAASSSDRSDDVDVDKLGTDVSVEMARVINVRIAICFAGLCALFLFAWPVANEFSDRTTISVNAALSLSASLAATTTLASIAGIVQRSTIKKLRARNHKLEKRVARLQGAS